MKKLVLALLVAGTLTACGGGGGKPAPEHNHGGSNAGSHTNNANANAGANHAGNAGSANAGNQANTQTGGLEALAFYDNGRIREAKALSLNRVVINGQAFDLNVSRNTPFSAIKASADERVFANAPGLLQYGRVGLVEFSSKEEPFFILGDVTKNMPESGTALYRGFSAYTDENLPEDRQDFSLDFTANVDFGKKTVQGDFGRRTSFTSTIKGHRFEGDGAYGLFVGPNAAEMVGVFDRDNGREDLTAIFGAKKQ